MRMMFLILVLVALLLPEPAGALIKLPSIKNKLIELALDQISTPGSFEITAGAIEELEGGVTSLVDLRISDGEGDWLTMERLNFAWQPNALLSGELAITRLELIGTTVLRRPSENAEPPELKPQEPSGRGLFDWPRAPIALSIDGVRLERVLIAEGVLPQPIGFDAEGRAFDKGDLQELALSLRRTDAVAGSIELAMQRDFAAKTVKLNLNASEAPGGMVAVAAGFPADAPAQLVLTADGPPEDWRVIFDAAVERVFDAAGRATLAYADQLSVDADLAITPGPELTEAARAILGERAHLTTRIIERDDGMIEVLSGALSSSALTLNASGAFATGAGESDLAVALEALSPLAALADGVDFERFSFDGRVTGPQGALAAEGRIALSALATAAVDAGRLALDGSVAQTPEGWRFDLAGTGEGLRLDRLGPKILGPAKLSADGELAEDLLTLAHAGLESRALTVIASGSYDLAGGAGILSAEMAAPQIALLAAAYGTTAEGSVSAAAEVALTGERIEADLSAALERFALNPVAAECLALAGRVTQKGGRIAFDLTGDGTAIMLNQVPRDLTRALQIVAKGAMEAGTVALDEMRLAAPLVTAEASGSVALEDKTLAVDYSLGTADLAPVARAYGVEAAGALDAAGRAEGPFAALRLTGQALIAEAGYGGRSYGAAALNHDVTLGEVPAGSLKLEFSGGALDDGAVEAQFRRAGAALTLEALTARLLGVQATGNAAVDLDTSLADGALDLSSRDLGPIGRFAGLGLGGAAEGRVSLTSGGGRQDLATQLALSRLSLEGVAAARARLQMTAADALGAPRLDASLDAAGVAAGEIELTDLRAKLAGPLGALAFSAETDGTLGGEPLRAALTGEADARSAAITATLTRAEATAGPDSARLRQPLGLRIDGGSVAATGLDLALPGEASLTGDAARHPGGYAGELTLSRLPMDLLQRRAGAPFSAGQVDARTKFDTRPGRAGADLSVAARELKFSRAEADAGALDLDLDAGWDGARLDATGKVSGEFGDPVNARLAMPLRTGPGGLPRVPPGGTLDGAVAWSGDIGDLWALVPVPGHILDGHADIDLSLGGRIDAPRVAGRADITDGQYQNLTVGTILTDLTLRTTIAEDGTVNLALDAADGADGDLEAAVALSLGARPSVDASARIDKATLMRRDDVAAEVSGDLTLVGPLSDLRLAGRIMIDRAEIRLINTTPPDLVDLEGIRIKGAPEPEAGDGGPGGLTLDLVVEAKQDVFVRGRGLDSEWKMNLAISGNAAAPVVTGAIEKRRGHLNLLGRPFELTRGQVRFDGGREIDPLLDVLLEHEANDIRDGIALGGRASSPELRFVSTPALPEDEVMPRLLFGRSKQSLSGPEALQLVAGMAKLMSGKTGPLDTVRGAAGIDVLRVEGQTAETASVTVGSNVAEGVFVGARQGLGEQGNAVVVEVEVFDGVVVDSDIGGAAGADIGITLRKDF